MSIECEGCGCVKNYNNNSEFCGRLARNNNKVTTVGCNTRCEQCKLCNYSNPNNKTSTVRDDRSLNNIINNHLNRRRGHVDEDGNGYNNRSGSKINSNSNPLDRKAFLEFLKSQQEMNRYDGFGPNNIPRRTNNNNNKTSNNNLVFEQINEDIGFENMEQNKLEKGCSELQENKCNIEKGCKWSKENVMCSDLEVKFYTGNKVDGEVFTLKVGNYDLNELNNLDFFPEFIGVPKGLRVKIWKKSGFVGEFDAFLGNYDSEPNSEDLYPVNYFGSLQICNMVTCSKPSEHYHLKLINVLSGNDIDEIEKVPVGNIQQYKNKLRKNIKNRLEYIQKTKNECLDDVLDYFVYNDIDIKKNIEDEDNIDKLHRIKHILTNMPSCEKLIHYNKFYKEKKENEKKQMLRKECPKYLIDLKKVKDEKDEKGFEMSNDEIKLLSPSFVEDLRYKVRERNVEADRIFKDEDFKLIILISIVLLLVILVFILIKFVYRNNTNVIGNKKNNFYNNNLNNYNDSFLTNNKYTGYQNNMFKNKKFGLSNYNKYK